MRGLFVILGFTAVILLCIWLYAYNRRRALACIAKWAEDSAIQILELKFRPLKRGPFLLKVRDGDQIYQITAERADKQVATGWLRCNIAMTGRLAGRVDVQWDELRAFPVIIPGQNEFEPQRRGDAEKKN